MSALPENYERDIAWLGERIDNVSIADQEFFCDKVALLMLDDKKEREARLSALQLLIEKTNK